MNHALAQRSSVTLADLVAAVRRGGYEPRVVQGSPHLSATAQLVVAGAGWIITVRSVAENPPRGTAVIAHLLAIHDDILPASPSTGMSKCSTSSRVPSFVYSAIAGASSITVSA